MLLVQNQVAQVFRRSSALGQRRHAPLLPGAHRNDHDAALQGRGDLLMHVIPATRTGAGRHEIHPAGPDDDDEHGAAHERLVELAVETLPGEQLVDIHKDVGLAEAAGQPIVNAAGVARDVIPTIADEDTCHRKPGTSSRGTA